MLQAKVAQTEAGYEKLEAELQALQKGYERDIFDERAKAINDLSEINARIPLLKQSLNRLK